MNQNLMNQFLAMLVLLFVFGSCRTNELNYLTNIKSDLHLNLIELKDYITTRETSVNSAEIILEMFENKKDMVPEEFNFHNLNVQIWYPFNKNNNAFQELINSGNLAIISNDSIKNLPMTHQKMLLFVDGFIKKLRLM